MTSIPPPNYNPLLIKYLVSRNIFESEPFSLAASFQRLLPGSAAMNSLCDGNAGRRVCQRRRDQSAEDDAGLRSKTGFTEYLSEERDYLMPAAFSA